MSYCTFALGYESRKEARLFVRVGVGVGVGVGVEVGVGVGFGVGGVELEPPTAVCWIVFIVTS